MGIQDNAQMEVAHDSEMREGWLLSEGNVLGQEAEHNEMGDFEVKFMPPQIYRIEDIEKYRAGGYHPILLNDELKDGQYKIMHKLGSGGFATVWLAQDIKKERYVAIKIIVAEASEDAMSIDIKAGEHLRECASPHSGSRYIDIPIEHFWIKGPNGRHLCIVSELAGPSIAQLSHARLMGERVTMLGPRDAQMIALQITQCLEFLHSPEVGIAHGDLTSANVLLELENLDTMSPEELIRILGEPAQERMQSYGDHQMDASAPDLIYECIDPMRLLPYCKGNIKIIDFGASYFLNNPPTGLATPLIACAPEYLRDGKFGKEADVWAFANTLFEIRAGFPLMTQLMGGNDEVLYQIQSMLGSLPPRAEDGEARDAELDPPLLKTLIADIQNMSSFQQYDERCSKNSWIKSALCGVQKGAQNCRKWLKRLMPSKGVKVPPKISPEEAEQFHDLLCKLFQYDVEKRLTVDQIWKHTWFTIRL
ncbi:hypothetical protein WAI453_012622 [Rhynchosporium graminicola]